MTRTTIDFGIDLGTTNSEIAVLSGVRAEIIKNNINMEATPSAVWIDAKNRLYVGQRAKERVESDSNNAFCEFKRKMGTNEQFRFEQSGRTMSPQELSAEVLKALKNNAYQRLGEEICAAVITVPADFELPQTNATLEAARLAGLTQSPLLQEPIAAALAYGFQNKSEKTFWFVYDLGGGTFDATLIQLREGTFQVIAHGGDKFLGGKDIDWDVINRLFVPCILKDLKLGSFERGDPKWRGAFAKLKAEAEKAKILLSNEDSTTIYIPNLINDYDFEFELKRSDLIPLAEPYVQRTIETSKRVLRDANVAPGNIEKMLLVGGPTLAPYLRDMLMDPKTGLAIPLEFSLDPFSIVAQGAAIFAGTQRLEAKGFTPTAPNQITIQLEYQPVGSDPEPIVGGKVICLGIDDLSKHAVEFTKINGASQGWSSGKILLGKNGSFTGILHAEANIQNLYRIIVYDSTGNALAVQPDELKYTIGNAPSSQPIIHSMGIALANNEVIRFFEKGTSLPARRLEKLHTTIDLRKGASGEFLNIPVVEGENLRANRNREIGSLKIVGTAIRRDVPIGSEIEITVSMDQSRDVIVKAYLPILDEEYDHVIQLENIIPDSTILYADFENEKQRIEKLIMESENAEDDRSRAKLDAVASSEEVSRINGLLRNSASDSETANECQQRILELKVKIDTIEDEVRWPSMVATAKTELDLLNTVVEEYGNDKIKQIQSNLEIEVNRAIENHQPENLERKTAEVTEFRIAILRAQPEFWINGIAWMEENKTRMKNQELANQWLTEANKAYQAKDLERIKIAVQELADLLPTDEQKNYDSGFGSTLMR